MRVKLLVSRSCSVIGAHSAGDEIEVDNAEALRMIQAGQAEPVAKTPAKRAQRRPAARRVEKRA